jgi:phenylacetate-CoA ligase
MRGLESISSILRLVGLHFLASAGKARGQGFYKKWQGDRLRTIVKKAYENVPLYREKYDTAGIKPEDIRSLGDIGKLPIITKDDLRASFPDRLRSRRMGPEKCIVISTSGSTGAPVRLYQSKRIVQLAPYEFLLGLALMPKILGAWAGQRIGKKIMLIIPEDERFDVYLIVKRVLSLPVFLRKSLRAVSTAENPRDHIRAIQAEKPDVIASDVMALSNMAAIVRAEGLALPPVPLLIVGGEFMDDRTRRTLARTLEAEILEHYGAEEVGTIAFECSAHQGLHILWQSVLVEVLNEGKSAPAGTPGDIVVTNLWNTVCPIIRYSGLGDVGVMNEERCACGSLRPRLRLLQGRNVDSVVLPDGRLIHPFSLTLALEHIPGIARYQILQEEPDRLRVLIVPEDDTKSRTGFEPDGPLADMVVQNLQKVLGQGIRIKVEPVDGVAAFFGPPSNPPVVRSSIKKLEPLKG